MQNEEIKADTNWHEFTRMGIESGVWKMGRRINDDERMTRDEIRSTTEGLMIEGENLPCSHEHGHRARICADILSVEC